MFKGKLEILQKLIIHRNSEQDEMRSVRKLLLFKNTTQDILIIICSTR